MRLQSRDYAIDILKGLAIGSVVLTHVLSSLPGTIYQPPTRVFFIALNQFLRFNVPLFLILSGYGLGKKYLVHNFRAKSYWLKRFLPLAGLYLGWSAVIYMVLHLTPQWSAYVPDIKKWQTLLLGQADYHLYFIPLIFQCYLVFPLLLYLSRRYNRYLLMAGFLLQLLVILSFTYWIESKPGSFNLSDQNQYLFLGSWIFYFILGLSISRIRLETWKQRYPGLTVGIAALTLFSFLWVVGDALRLINQGIDVIVATRFTRLPIVVYASSFALTGLIFGSVWHTLPRKITHVLSFMGKYSLVIFLSHTLILRVVFAYLNHALAPSLLLGISLIIAAALFISMYYLKQITVALNRT